MIHPRAPFTRPAAIALCLGLAASPVPALDVTWPEGAELARDDAPALGSRRIATGPFGAHGVPSDRVEGLVSDRIWRVPGPSGDPLRLLDLVRGQLIAQGYEIGFVCAADACGGFDFRHALPIAGGPAMHVDLANYHYLTARKSDAAGPSAVALTVSRGGLAGYAHLAVVAPPGAPAPTPAPAPAAVADGAPDAPTDALADALTRSGRAPLDDLIFATGASALSGARYDSLARLADYLIANPDRRVVLVGHTDAEGPLEGNIALSRARASAVRQVLIDDFGAPSDRIDAEGIGFLAPRASNATDAGRQANRRVEVVLAE